MAPGETRAALWPERTAGVQPQAVLAEVRTGPVLAQVLAGDLPGLCPGL